MLSLKSQMGNLRSASAGPSDCTSQTLGLFPWGMCLQNYFPSSRPRLELIDAHVPTGSIHGDSATSDIGHLGAPHAENATGECLLKTTGAQFPLSSHALRIAVDESIKYQGSGQLDRLAYITTSRRSLVTQAWGAKDTEEPTEDACDFCTHKIGISNYKHGMGPILNGTDQLKRNPRRHSIPSGY